MRVRLKGVNSLTKKLASGQMVTYYYAWKGGPRLPGRPGDPEFIAAYNAAVAQKVTAPAGTLQTVIDAYQASPRFTDLAPRTRRDYIGHIRLIERQFGDFPIAALDDRRTRDEFLTWRDTMAARSRRQADYVFATFAAILAWAHDRGKTPANPCARPRKLYRGSRTDTIWTEADEAALARSAPPHLWLAFLLAIHTGQRQGDLLRLTWTAYDGRHIRLKQGKTGQRVVIPVTEALKAALDTAPRRAVTILTTLAGTSWTGWGFSASWRKAVAAAGLTDLTFHDLRGTAVTRLALAGCSTIEIATITGHSLKDVETILDRHYLKRDVRFAESAVAKLDRHGAGTNSPN